MDYKYFGVSHSVYNTVGQLHNIDGPARVWRDNSLTEWFINGEYHRIDGPARIWLDGTNEWYEHGKLHRIDGPAGEYPPGHTKDNLDRWDYWWAKNDKRIHNVDEIIAYHQLNPDWTQWTEGEKLIFRFATS